MQNASRKSPYKAVLFDWDGTIADTSLGIFNSIHYAVREHGIPDKSNEELGYFIGPPLYDGFETVFGVSPELANELTDTYRVYYKDKGIFECEVYDGVDDLVRELHATGYKTAVVSSKPMDFLTRLVEHFGLSNDFDVVVGPEMKNHVSDKKVLVERALAALEVEPSEAAMIGDRHFDMEGASQAGVFPVGILYGFGSEEELRNSGAGAICEKVSDVKSIFCG